MATEGLPESVSKLRELGEQSEQVAAALKREGVAQDGLNALRQRAVELSQAMVDLEDKSIAQAEDAVRDIMRETSAIEDETAAMLAGRDAIEAFSRETEISAQVIDFRRRLTDAMVVSTLLASDADLTLAEAEEIVAEKVRAASDAFEDALRRRAGGEETLRQTEAVAREWERIWIRASEGIQDSLTCLLYTSDAADE